MKSSENIFIAKPSAPCHTWSTGKYYVFKKYKFVDMSGFDPLKAELAYHETKIQFQLRFVRI